MIEELNGDFIQWLRGFYYIAKTGSLRRAAPRQKSAPESVPKFTLKPYRSR